MYYKFIESLGAYKRYRIYLNAGERAALNTTTVEHTALLYHTEYGYGIAKWDGENFNGEQCATIQDAVMAKARGPIVVRKPEGVSPWRPKSQRWW